MYFTKISIHVEEDHIDEIHIIDENNETITLTPIENGDFTFFISHPTTSKSVIKLKFIIKELEIEFEKTITLHSKFYASKKEFKVCFNRDDMYNISFDFIEC